MNRARLVLLALLSALSACVATPPPPANAPLAPPPQVQGASLITLPVTLDLEQAAAGLLRDLPRPLLRHTQRRPLPVRLTSFSTTVAPEPGSCSVTALNCLARQSVRLQTSDTLGTTEAEVTQQMQLRDLRLAMDGSRLTLVAEIEVAVTTRLADGSVPLGAVACGGGRARPRLELTQHGHVSWSPEGRVLLGSDGHALRWRRGCDLAGFPGGVDSLLELPVLRERLREAVEREVLNRRREQALAARLEKAWPALVAPRELRPGVWLLTHPEQVAYGDLAGQDRELVTAVLVQARPEIVTGSRPPLAPLALPVAARRRLDGEGLRLAVRGDMALSDAERQLRRRLADALRQVDGVPVSVARVRVWGNGDRAVLGIVFREPRLAELHLYARPVYDQERNEVAFVDMAFSPDSREYLARTAQQLLAPGLVSALQDAARFRFDEELAGALHDFRDLRVAAGSDLMLSGGVQRVQPQALYFTRDRLVALLVVEGRLALEARQR